MPIKVHTCPNTWIHGGHPCWKVLKAFDDAGIPYEHVKEPLRRGKREEGERLSGQRKLPIVELEDGTVHKESKDIIGLVESGKLGAAPAAPPPPPPPA